mmetsp:Transcript_15323/g.33180  ORF Transcript_15323/g.33180 Transcript_15323/m.33180 type:complete len:228 (+) Transcript_15323:868-1551(+)
MLMALPGLTMLLLSSHAAAARPAAASCQLLLLLLHGLVQVVVVHPVGGQGSHCRSCQVASQVPQRAQVHDVQEADGARHQGGVTARLQVRLGHTLEGQGCPLRVLPAVAHVHGHHPVVPVCVIHRCLHHLVLLLGDAQLQAPAHRRHPRHHHQARNAREQHVGVAAPIRQGRVQAHGVKHLRVHLGGGFNGPLGSWQQQHGEGQHLQSHHDEDVGPGHAHEPWCHEL